MQVADLFYSVRGEGFDRLERSMYNASKKVGDIGKAFKDNISDPLTDIALNVVDTTMTFDKQMSRVSAVTGETGKGFDDLRELAQDMGSNTSKSATEAAEAIEYMGLAGWNLKQINEGLEPVLRASEAGMMDLGTTSDLVTDSMSALGIGTEDLGRYLDIAAKAQNTSNQSMEQFLNAMVTAGGSFKMFNVPLEEAGGLLGTLANRGYKGSEAGNALISIMNNLTTGTGAAGKAMEDLNIDIYDSHGKFRGMTTILKELNGKFDGMTEAQKNTYIQMIGGKTRTKELNALLNGTKEELDDLTQGLYNSDGALSDMAKTMQDNLAGEVTSIESKIEGLAISFGDRLTPYLEKAAEWIEKIANWFNDLPGPIKDIIVILGIIAVAAGVFITALMGIVSVAGLVISGITAVIGVIGGLLSGVGLLLIPVGLLGAGFAALTGVLALLGIGEVINKFGSLENAMKALQIFINETLVPAFKFLISGEGLDGVKNVSEGTRQKLQGIRNVFESIKSFIFESLVPALKYLATGEGLENVKGASGKVEKGLKSVRQKMVDLKAFIMETLVPSLAYLVTGDEGSLNKVESGSSNLKEELKKLRKTITDIRDYIEKTLIPSLQYLAGGKGLEKVEGASDDTRESLKKGREIIEKVAKAIDDFDVSSMINEFSDIIEAINDVISTAKSLYGWFEKINKFNIGAKIGEKIGKGITDLATGHADGIRNNPYSHYAWVGEDGPEIMRIPRGADIYSNAESREIATATSMQQINKTEQFILNGDIVIDGKTVEEFNSIIDLFKSVNFYKNMM